MTAPSSMSSGTTGCCATGVTAAEPWVSRGYRVGIAWARRGHVVTIGLTPRKFPLHGNIMLENEREAPKFDWIRRRINPPPVRRGRPVELVEDDPLDEDEGDLQRAMNLDMAESAQYTSQRRRKRKRGVQPV